MEDWFRKYLERFRKEIDRIFEEIRELEIEISKPLFDWEQKTLVPLYEMKRLVDELIIYVDLPGVREKKDINVQIAGNKLIIEAKLNKPFSMPEYLPYTGAEFRNYRLELSLPENIDEKKCRAFFKAGVLEIHIPLKIKKVKVKVE